MTNNTKVHISWFITILILFLLVIGVNSIIVEDDLFLPICSSEYIKDFGWIAHGRFITCTFIMFFIKIVPHLLNIHPQDFAFFSESIVNSILFFVFLYIINKLYSKFSKNESPLQTFIVYGLSLAVLVSISFKLQCLFMYYSSIWFQSYFVCLIYYFILLHKIIDYYVKNKQFSKKDFCILAFLTVCNAAGNEQVCLAFLFLLACLIIEHIYKKSKLPGYLIPISIINLITFILTTASKGTQILIKGYNIHLVTSFNPEYVLNFIKTFMTVVVFDNIFLWIIFAVCIFIINIDKQQIETNKNFNKIIIYSILGFIIFMLSTYFLTATCVLCINTYDYEHEFWFLHKGLIFQFDIYLYCITILVAGYVINLKKSFILKIIFIVISLIFTAFNSYMFYSKPLINDLYFYNTKEKRQCLYIIDKLSIFYFSKGQTAILPKQPYFHLTFGDTLWIYSNDSKKIYTKYDKEDIAWYLAFIEKYYNVDVSPGLTFRPYDEAIETYKKNGGILTEEELEKLKFNSLIEYSKEIKK